MIDSIANVLADVIALGETGFTIPAAVIYCLWIAPVILLYEAIWCEERLMRRVEELERNANDAYVELIIERDRAKAAEIKLKRHQDMSLN